LICQWSRLSFSAGAIHRNVESIEAFDCTVDKSLHIGFLTNVGVYEFGFGAEGAKLSDECLACIIATT
jgi:hypothetical protein